MNAWMNNVPFLSRGKDRCTLLIHPDDAAALDVDDRDHVAVTSGESRIVVPVELTPHIKRGVVSMPHGWGHDRPGAQLNVARSNPGVNKIGRAHVCNPVTNAHIVCRLLMEKKKINY